MKAAAAGAAFFLLLFAAEGALILRDGAIGLEMPTEGPFAALFAVVRPLLPPLLLRIAFAYAVAGAVFGCVAGVVVHSFAVERKRGRVFVVALVGAVLVVLWDRAIARPALFDDLPATHGVLSVLVKYGEPWHPRAVAGALWMLVVVAGVRRMRFLAVGAAAVFLVTFASFGVTSSEGKPLVVMIGVDALRPDRLGTGVTPNLDRLLAGARVYDRAFTPIAQTEPAWRSLLTSRLPFEHGVRYPLSPFEERRAFPTFVETFRANGYRTEFFTDCSRFHYEPEDVGFSVRTQPPRGAINFALEKFRFRVGGTVLDNRLGAWWLPELVDNRALAGIHDPMGYAERLAKRVTSQANEGPTLIAFHATAAHFPGDPVYPFYRRSMPEDAPLERKLRMKFSPIVGAVASPSGREISEALYDELIAQADAQVGVLLDSLERGGYLEHATVVIFSDHGESFHADHPELAGATPVHGARLSEEESHVVLAIRGPGFAAGRDDRLASLLDIGPTLLSSASLPALPDARGVDLLGAVQPRALYLETGFTHASPAVFDPLHLSGAPREFGIYRIHPDGVIDTKPEFHAEIVAEKDVGVTDGTNWFVRAPQRDREPREECRGDCSLLAAFLHGVSDGRVGSR